MTDTQNEQDKQRGPFEAWWNREVISSVTGEIDRPLWGDIDKESSLVIWQAALSHAAQAKWQPIETAPKDGTLIDLWYPIRGRITNRRWYRKNKFWGGEVGKFDRIATLDEEPTHWIPLPDAPKETTK